MKIIGDVKMNNHVHLEGNLGKDPELRQTQSGVKVATYSIGVYKNNPKDKDKPLTNWFNIVAWGEQAELVMNSLKKGTKITLDGTLNTRDYDDRDGKKVYVTEVIQESFGLMPKKEKAAEVTPVTMDDLPF